MTERTDALMKSATLGAEAKQLLDHPLFADMFERMQQNAIEALCDCAVDAHSERLALSVVLKTLRELPKALAHAAETGEFDAAQLAKLAQAH